MSEIKIIDWNSIKATFVGKTVAQLDNVDLANASVTESPKLSIKEVSLSLGASAKLSINAYNDATDTDDLQVVGVPGSKTADGGTLDPRIPYDAANAWLRYSLVGQLSAGIKAELKDVGIGVEADSQIVFSDYRVHKPTDAADVVVPSDLSAPRTALNVDDVRALGNSEALYYELRGSLLFSVTVSWSDIYTKTLSQIAKSLPSTEAFAIDVEVGASASFSVTLTDDFVLVFWRDAGGVLHAGVRKASTRSAAGAIGFNAIAKFNDPTAAASAATAFLQGYLGVAVEKIEGILAKEIASLSDDEKKIVAEVAEKLGVDPSDPDAIKKKLDELEGKLQEKITTAAESEIGASWKYEYSRVESTQFVVEAPITDEQLTALHPSLVAQNVRPTLADSSIALTKYLDETTVVRTRSVGFSLGIGKWWRIGDQDTTTLTTRTRRSRDQKRSMISCVGARTFGGDKNWSIGNFAFDFRADMAEYKEVPSTADFDFGLALTMTTAAQTLTDDAIAAIVDTASLWSIIGHADSNGITQKLAAAKGKIGTAEFELTFDRTILRSIAPIAGAMDEKGMAFALGAAMQWLPHSARSSWQTRSAVYGPAWLLRLHDDADFNTAFAAASDAANKAHVALVNDDNTPPLWSLRSMIEGQPNVGANYAQWVDGMNLLATALNPDKPQPSSTLETIFKDSYAFFSQVLYVRAMGWHMVDIASRSGSVGDIGRAATVSYTDGASQKTIAIGSKA